MNLVFYILQLLSPEPFSETSQKASVESLQSVYESYHAQVYLEKETSCLTRIVFNEARGEPSHGKKLVAQTTINRIKSGDFKDSVCVELKAKGAYSFYKANSKKSVDRPRKYPLEYTKIAEEALAGKYEKLISHKVVYFKNCSKYNGFFNKLHMVKKVGNHCFFREYDKLVAEN